MSERKVLYIVFGDLAKSTALFSLLKEVEENVHTKEYVNCQFPAPNFAVKLRKDQTKESDLQTYINGVASIE